MPLFGKLTVKEQSSIPPAVENRSSHTDATASSNPAVLGVKPTPQAPAHHDDEKNPNPCWTLDALFSSQAPTRTGAVELWLSSHPSSGAEQGGWHSNGNKSGRVEQRRAQVHTIVLRSGRCSSVGAPLLDSQQPESRSGELEPWNKVGSRSALATRVPEIAWHT
ncbi:hypothetical protein BP6252_01291 [Coleophoma cylindrospora]|uniref:Uncharacterized protein n=1 Tax=Coleophoma cylindrospora TaxID=1849047 RepID=A0A3D8SSF9_9HELO|nr:hypothetical protein BP6252_01291 [Coleophoma cylindrospora]